MTDTRVVIRTDLLPPPDITLPGSESYECPHGTLTCNSRARWDNELPFDFKTAFAILTRDITTSVNIDFQMRPSEKDYFFKITAPGMECTRSHGPLMEPRVFGSGILYINPHHQFGGTGRILIRNQIEFAAVSGLYDESYSQAALDNGAYTWARFGLLPTDLNSNESTLQEKIRGRLRAIWPILRPQEISYLQNCENFLRAPKSLWHLADAEFDLSDRLCVMETGLRDKVRCAFNATYYYGHSCLTDIFDRAQAGKRVTLGQFALVGTAWDAHIDFHNAEQMQRVADYTGGFKYLAFE